MAVLKIGNSWYAKYPVSRKVDGKIKYRQKKVGYSKKLADQYYRKMYDEFQRRELLGISHEEADRKPKTFGDLVDWYLDLEIVKPLKTYRDVQYRALLLKGRFGNWLASEIRPSDIENYQAERRKEKARKHGAILKTKVSPASINRETQVMKRIYNLAVRDGFVNKNPCWKVQRLKESNKRDRVITHNEFQRLVGALPLYAADVVRTAYWTGMRAGEIFGLTWDKVCLKEGFITLEAQDTKSREPRIIHLNDELLDVFSRRGRIRSIIHNSVFTFPGSNRPLTTIRHSFRRASLEVGIEDFRFHDLRHTFNTNMRKADVPESVIMKMTGHRSREMFDRYNTVDKEDAQDALRKLDDFLKFQNSSKRANHLDTQISKC